MDNSAVLRDKNIQTMHHIEQHLKTVETLIKHHVSLSHTPLVYDVITHIIGAGGKRIRPALCLMTAALMGGVTEKICLAATAIEFIHTATLLHDDVVDAGEQRRGKRTANMVWGNECAVLVGDHLFARAFSLLSDIKNFDILTVISRASEQLSDGEVLQLSLKNRVPTLENYFYIIHAKTASLFSAACETGAILTKTSSDNIKNMAEFGLNFGLIFQIIDDILDYTSSTDMMGKKTGDDFFEGKYTLPLILAYEKSSDDIKQKIHKMMQASYMRTADDFGFIMDILQNTHAINDAKIYAVDLCKKNKKILAPLPDSDIKVQLIKMCDDALSRKL